MSKWDVLLTKKAESDLRAIYEYIAFSLLEPEIARNQISRIQNCIKSLEEMPERHAVFKNEPWKQMGLRLMTVDNYCVFYQAIKNENSVVIIRIGPT